MKLDNQTFNGFLVWSYSNPKMWGLLFDPEQLRSFLKHHSDRGNNFNTKEVKLNIVESSTDEKNLLSHDGQFVVRYNGLWHLCLLPEEVRDF